MKISNPIAKWRKPASAQHTKGTVVEQEGYGDLKIPRITWKGFVMGVLVSSGKSMYLFQRDCSDDF